MPISDALLPEFDHEMATTRKFLERVPDDRLAWKPHQKSFSVGQLGTHLSNIPSWIGDTFDKNVVAGRQALASAKDQTIMGSWSLLSGGKTIMTMPRIAVLRSFIMNHVIHHRAQLGVYLRLCDIPVPQAYGPTADEAQF